MRLTLQLLHSAEIVRCDYQANSLSLRPPSQEARYHSHSFDKRPRNSANSCRVQTNVPQWTHAEGNRICISISGNAGFAELLARWNGWTAHFISLGISNSSLRSMWWQSERCEKVSSHLLPLRFQQRCRSERLYLASDSSQRVDRTDKSPALSSSFLIIKISSAPVGSTLTTCLRVYLALQWGLLHSDRLRVWLTRLNYFSPLESCTTLYKEQTETIGRVIYFSTPWG